MKRKIKLIIILACSCLVLIIAGAVGLVSCENAPSDSSSDKEWTSNY